MRVAEHPIEPLFLQRTSPRAMNGAPLAIADLARPLEAARWAPSSANAQPWRFVYALAETPAFEGFLEALAEGNRVWCRRAGALLVLAAKTTFEDGRPNPHHMFDCGSAWMSFALQAHLMGLVAHAMAGFDPERAAAVAALPPGHVVCCMIAAGHPGKVEELPERLRAREIPSPRRHLADLAFEATFPEAAAPSPAG
jgi:nitroreductase